jgi:hypothetical protein
MSELDLWQEDPKWPRAGLGGGSLARRIDREGTNEGRDFRILSGE